MNQIDAMSAARRDLIIDFGGVITFSLFERCRDIEQLYRLSEGSHDASFQSVVFVDDQQKNIDGLIACGIEAIWLDITKPVIGFG